MIVENFIFSNNEIYCNNTASLLNDNKAIGLYTSYNKVYSVTWLDVGISWSFLFIPVIISFCMSARLELSIIVSSVRCLVQLTLMGCVLDNIIQSKNIFLVMIMTLILVLLGAYELSFIRAKKAIRHFFYKLFVILMISNITIAIMGSLFALKEEPFWDPAKFIPILGILLGKTMSSIAITIDQCLDNIKSDYGPVIELRLSLGASRYEATKPFAIEVIRISMLPIIVQLSVIGMINIPGTMVGQLMAGSSMMDAVIYQQVIMFMTTASSAFGVVMTVVVCMLTIINEDHMLCWNQIEDKKPIIQWKTVYNYFHFLFKYFFIPRLFYHYYRHYHKTTKQREQQDEADNEILSDERTDFIEKKHDYEHLEMKQMTQEKLLITTEPRLSSNDKLGVVTTSPSSSLLSLNPLSSSSKKL